ncbi:hypothetical protein ACOBQX_10230 [Actinokineospora sp. G85]|uniref:hypothetical protein n=1 Tax=Actinokineospora sp. G85 TaxID=3406626 RepID=UPI003C7447D2
MTVSDTDLPRGAADEFNQARSDAREDMSAQRVKAARTVAEHAIDAEDRLVLLAMLGLDREADGVEEPAPVG